MMPRRSDQQRYEDMIYGDSLGVLRRFTGVPWDRCDGRMGMALDGMMVGLEYAFLEYLMYIMLCGVFC